MLYILRLPLKITFQHLETVHIYDLVLLLLTIDITSRKIFKVQGRYDLQRSG